MESECPDSAINLCRAKITSSSFFHLVHFTRELQFNPHLSPSLLHIISCLPAFYRAGFLCVFKFHLKNSKDSDPGNIRTHAVPPPCPFFGVSKRKTWNKKKPLCLSAVPQPPPGPDVLDIPQPMLDPLWRAHEAGRRK